MALSGAVAPAAEAARQGKIQITALKVNADQTTCAWDFTVTGLEPGNQYWVMQAVKNSGGGGDAVVADQTGSYYTYWTVPEMYEAIDTTVYVFAWRDGTYPDMTKPRKYLAKSAVVNTCKVT